MRLHLPSLLLGWLAASCTASDADDGDTSGGPDPADDDDATTLDATAASDDDDDGATTPSDTSAVPSTDGSSSDDADDDDPSADDASSSSATDDASSSTGDPMTACAAGCEIEYGCQDTCECSTMWKSAEACTQWCEANLEKAALFSPFCRDAWEGMSACYATLDCDEYHQFHNPAVPDYPCVSEAETLAFECKGQ